MPTQPRPLRLIERFAEIREHYDALICDVWGVLHNGVRVWPEANAALIAARESGMAVVMLTNAARMPVDVEALVARLGGDARAWEALVSSGGVTRSILETRGDRPFHHIGLAHHLNVFKGLAARPVSFEDAEYVLFSALIDDETETAETYRPLLEAMLPRRLELICSNPDLVVERGHRLVPCPGAVADLYERMGGPVTWVGKPHPLVYEAALAEITRILGRTPDRSRILGVGDAVRTDLAGATAFGIDCLFVLDGIHAEETGARSGPLDARALERFFDGCGIRPAYATRALRP